MRIIFILILIFLSKASWSFTDYKYLICEIDNPKMKVFLSIKGFYFLQLIKANM